MADDKISDIASDDPQSDASTVMQLTRLADANVPAQVFTTIDGRTFSITRKDFELKDVSLPNAADVLAPKVIVEHVKLQNSISLAHYMNRFKNEASIMFADINTNTISGVIDYHKGIESGVKAVAGTHVATLTLPYAKEWETWMRSNEKLMSHTEFANFLEENAIDVFAPAGADLLELCRDLQIKQNMNFSSSIRMGDAVSISYKKEDDATTKSEMSLPAQFTLAIPVYFGESEVSVTCMMRRKIDDGKLWLGYKMVRAENIRQAEFQRVVHDLETDTDLAAVYGTRR